MYLGIVRLLVPALALIPAAYSASIGHEWMYFASGDIERLVAEGPRAGFYGQAITSRTVSFGVAMAVLSLAVGAGLRHGGLPWLRAMADGLLHVLPLGLTGPLLSIAHVPTRLIALSALLGAIAGAIAFRVLWEAPERAKRYPRLPAQLALGCVVAAGCAHATLSILRHRSHWSSVIDLGLFAGAVRSTARGEGFLYTPELGVTFLAEHFSPILVVLVPLYAWFDDPAVLLVAQAVAAAWGAWLLFRLAQGLLSDSWLALVVCVSYLLAPDMFQSHWHDFHVDLLMPPLIFGALLALVRNRTAWFITCVVLLWLTKEEAFVYTLLLGLYAWAVHRRRALGLGIAAASLAACAFVVGWVIPAFGRTQPEGGYFRHYGGEGYAFAGRYSHLGENFFEIAKSAVSRPGYVLRHVFTGDSLGSALTVTAPLGFAALVGGRGGLLLLSGCAVMLLASYPPMQTLSFYYGALPLALAYAAGVHGLGNVSSWLRRSDTGAQRARRFRVGAIAYTATASVGLLYLHPDVPFSPVNDRPAYLHTAHNRVLDEVARTIPAEVPVSATGYVGVHLMNRSRLRMLPFGVEEAEWLVMDLYRPAWPLHPRDLGRMVEQRLRDPNWGMVRAERGVFVFRRGAPAGDVELGLSLLDNPVFEAEEWETSRYANLARRNPDASGGFVLEVTPRDRRGPGFLFDGPGLPLRVGTFEASFRIALRAEAGRDLEQTAVTLDVMQDHRVLASGFVRFADAPSDGGLAEVALQFRADRHGAYGFRVFYHDAGTVSLDRIAVRRVAD